MKNEVRQFELNWNTEIISNEHLRRSMARVSYFPIVVIKPKISVTTQCHKAAIVNGVGKV
tara:strand:- start:316 stop:495 length:180 start_codon:yes stop_codon:yes gene_type:complete